MRRLLRILLNAATALSLIACAACLFWWTILCNGGAFDRSRYRNPSPFEADWLGVRMWAAVLASALLPLTRLGVGVWRGFGPLPPLPPAIEKSCSACAYDLRATPRWCPECGVVVG